MFDPRIYRASFVPVLLALLVVAFSLQDRPRPIGTTFAPDAFDGAVAGRLLDDLARNYPERRPGSNGDEGLSRRVANALRQALQPSGEVRTAPVVRVERFRGRTIDGTHDLTNVIATRPGRPGAGIVVVAHRDAAARGAKAELSGTAALIALAQIVGSGSLRRTVTFVSTSGGSGGGAGARDVISHLPARPDAVIVLGDMASRNTSRPMVVPFSGGTGVAPVQLRRTVEAALRAEGGVDPGGPRALVQFARQAFPVTTGEQGAFGRAGLPAVLLSATGERGPAADAPISRERLQGFGRAALRTIVALDNGPTIGGGPSASIQTSRKIVPGGAIRLLGGALLLPVLLVAIDGFARARRRREPVGRRLAWVAASTVPFTLTAAMAILLAMVGLIDPAPRLAVPAAGLETGGAALGGCVALLLVFLIAWLLLRPALLRAAGVADGLGESTAAPAVATLLVLAGVTLVIWVLNPFAAVLLAPALHFWLLAMTPDWEWPRAVRVAAVLVGLVPFVAVAAIDVRLFDYSLAQAIWQGVLLVAGGQVGAAVWLPWSVVAGTAACALGVALHPGERPPQGPRGAGTGTGTPVGSIRGPGGHVGPGALGSVGGGSRR